MTHYMLDRYFPDSSKPDGLRRESDTLKAANDVDAIEEARRFGPLKKPAFFKLRADDREIFDSRADRG